MRCLRSLKRRCVASLARGWSGGGRLAAACPGCLAGAARAFGAFTTPACRPRTPGIRSRSVRLPSPRRRGRLLVKRSARRDTRGACDAAAGACSGFLASHAPLARPEPASSRASHCSFSSLLSGSRRRRHLCRSSLASNRLQGASLAAAGGATRGPTSLPRCSPSPTPAPRASAPLAAG